MTTARRQFKVVTFVADHFFGGEFSVGALLRTDSTTKGVAAEHLPGTRCLGSAGAYSVLRSAIDSLMTHTSFDGLPPRMGPHFSLSNRTYSIPSSVEHPEQWLQGLLCKGVDTHGKSVGPRVSTLGRQFLRMYGIDSYVKNRFRPSLIDESKAAESSLMHPITHYVKGEGRLLLMEPLRLQRGSWKSEATSVYTRLSAHRHALSRSMAKNWECTFLGYMLPGVPMAEYGAALGNLGAAADMVIDGNRPADCLALRDLVESVATPLLN